MIKKLDERAWVKKYEQNVKDEDLIKLVDLPNLKPTNIGPWTFLKLAFLWSFAYHTYNPIAGNAFNKDISYVDLFSGSGLISYNDSSNRVTKLLGSPILMSTLNVSNPFKNCFFFEKNNYSALGKRLEILKDKGLLSCSSYNIFCDDCNSGIDSLIDELKSLGGHFLLFVDPWSTEIDWLTMEKLLSINYPAFDMIFNFQPFGVNRKRRNVEIMDKFFGDEEYKDLIQKIPMMENKLDALREYYIEKLKKYSKMVKTVRTIKVRSGKGGYYYDLLYTTRVPDPKWEKGIDHLANMIGRISGKDVDVMLDPTVSTLDKYLF